MASNLVKMSIALLLMLALSRMNQAIMSLPCNSGDLAGTALAPCLCEVDQFDDEIAVNCTNLNLPQEALLALPILAERITFTGNNWTELGTNILPENSALIDIDFSNNHIQKIHGKTFHFVRDVRRLSLDNNEWVLDQHTRVFSNFEVLEYLSMNGALAYDPEDPHAFVRKLSWILADSCLVSVREFHLQFNYMQLILDGDMFCPMEELRILHLANNIIYDTENLISAKCMSKVEELYLHNNSLTYIYEAELQQLDAMAKGSLSKVTLRNNSWHCTCISIPFIQWLQSDSPGAKVVIDRDQLRCQPDHLNGTRLLDVNIKDIHCSHQKNVAIIMLCVLFAAAIILVGICTWYHRGTIRNRVRKVSAPIIARWNSGPDYQGLVSVS